MIGKIIRFPIKLVAWTLFALPMAIRKWMKTRKARRELEAQRHAELLEANRNRK